MVNVPLYCFLKSPLKSIGGNAGWLEGRRQMHGSAQHSTGGGEDDLSRPRNRRSAFRKDLPQAHPPTVKGWGMDDDDDDDDDKKTDHEDDENDDDDDDDARENTCEMGGGCE